MVSTRECIEAFWGGQRPPRIPLTCYRMFTRCATPRQWRRLYEMGLAPVDFWAPFKCGYSGVEHTANEYDEGGLHWRRTAIQTPVGEVYSLHANNWPRKLMLVTPQDYRVMTYVVEHTTVTPSYDDWHIREREFMPHGICASATGRTPMQTILVDWAGLEQFSLHLFDFEDAVRTLYDALLRRYRRIVEFVAAGPGKMVSVGENFSADTMGPARFAQFHVPIYEELFPVIQQSGKIVGTHFDGKLASCRDLIARSPIDLIESLTPPPEGDLTLKDARAAWPRKLFWSNINVGAWGLPPAQLKAEVLRRVADGSDHGARLAFEISEDRPANWEQAIPVVLDALDEASRTC